MTPELLIVSIALGFYVAVLNEDTLPRLIRGYIPLCTMCFAFWVCVALYAPAVLIQNESFLQAAQAQAVTVISATVTSKYLLK